MSGHEILHYPFLVTYGEVGVEAAVLVGVIGEGDIALTFTTPPTHGTLVRSGARIHWAAISATKRVVEAVVHCKVAESKRIAEHCRCKSAARRVVEHHVRPTVVEHWHITEINHIVAVAVDVVAVGEQVVD